MGYNMENRLDMGKNHMVLDVVIFKNYRLTKCWLRLQPKFNV
jgi:hypothetical protein